MRCARIVPNKWYEHKELDFLTGLTMRRSTVPTSVLGPRNLTNVMLRRVLARSVRTGCVAPKQGPRDSSDLVRQGDYGLVPVHAPIERLSSTNCAR
jgi:hypothetical protein